MYEINLKESLFPEQSHSELWDIAVGELLRDIAEKYLCRTFLSPQKTPTKWVLVNEFPMTGSGKVQKFAIREKWLSGKYGVEIHDNSN